MSSILPVARSGGLLGRLGAYLELTKPRISVLVLATVAVGGYLSQWGQPAWEAVLHAMLGVDLTQINGIGPYSALRIVSECGTDMTRWPTAKHFTSWLTLAPHNRISGGRLLDSRTPRSANRAAAILRLAATTVGRTQTALGAFYRRLAVRIGAPKAVTATARKLAILVYRALEDHLVYADPGADAYDAQHRARVVRRLRQRATTLGLGLVDLSTGELVNAAVS